MRRIPAVRWLDPSTRMADGLLDFAEEPERAAIESALTELARPLADPLAWAVRPQLYHLLGAAGRGGRTVPVLRHVAASVGRRTGMQTVRVGALLFLVDTRNHRAVLEPVIQATCRRLGSRPEELRDRSARRAMLAAGRTAARTAAAVARAASGRGHDLDRGGLLQMTLGAARSAARARAALRGAEALVVSNQHQPHIRAYLAVARELGVPSLYVPHAPVARTRDYVDLPVDAAGLRGEAEVRLYVDAGCTAPPGRLVAIGNPAVEPVELAPERSSGPIVLAVSPLSVDRLRSMVRLVASATDDAVDEVVVAPHPRSDAAMLRRLVPGSWSFVPGGRSTFEHLRTGARAVLQSGSGVAWESSYLGIPTIDVRPWGGRPATMLSDSDLIPLVRDAAGLRRALAAAPSSGSREARRQFAAQWAHPLGRRAAEQAADLLLAVAEGGPGVRPLFDRWR